MGMMLVLRLLRIISLSLVLLGRFLDLIMMIFLIRNCHLIGLWRWSKLLLMLAIFDMGDEKAPGPDGFSVAFFKSSWDVIGPSVIESVRDFFVPAFVPGRRIFYNIQLTQNLMHNYYLDRGTSRCAFKVDIQKAYDTVDWRVLKRILIEFGFHPHMIHWIMMCVATPSFSLSINGSLHGFFAGKRGLRQGDSLSPYLFTLVMEVLTLLLKRKVSKSGDFTYHPQSEELDIINLCFADDLIIFLHADVKSATVVMKALDEFKATSGLAPSLPKGKLPVKYLGVPLVSTRLIYSDCRELVERVQDRISDCKNKFLSFAGHLQLVQSVLSSMHVYWSTMFMLPSRIIQEIEHLLRGFLWSQGKLKRGQAKVAWDVVCLPKSKGGLGIRRLESFNVALLSVHIWNLFTHKESLWLSSSVSGLVTGNDWNWPQAWKDRFQNLNPPSLSNVIPDALYWKGSDGTLQVFSVETVWNDIRPRIVEVDWFHVVWYPQCIPKHAFHLWLVMKKKLKTQDLLRLWDVPNGLAAPLVCTLCELQADSHDHLFFQSTYSMQVWIGVCARATIHVPWVDWNDIVASIIPTAIKKSAENFVKKLVLASTSYYIWQERNSRLFMKKSKRSPQQLMEVILGTVRLKLITLKFKQNSRVGKMRETWNLPSLVVAT
uniref:uncharacterized protein LOC122610272 n=1 Tax=Erigeron canadensis TaxID=72917 RepID=UPI001CB9910D|nr:uncharacterized protein LOC122610272 [Erigeron canadensis]